MKTYNILKGEYNGVIKTTIKLPDTLKLIYNDGRIASTCHIGHNHYLGCIKKSDEHCDYLMNEYESYDFDDLVFFIIDNIKFIEDSPEFYTSSEFMKEFEINKYCIEYREKLRIDNINEIFEKLNEVDNPKLFLEENVPEPKTCEICKITKVEGPYDITCVSVMNHSSLIDEEHYQISEEKEVHINRLCESTFHNIRIYKNDDTKFKEMINNVINRLNS